jgi:hypothetical protein
VAGNVKPGIVPLSVGSVDTAWTAASIMVQSFMTGTSKSSNGKEFRYAELQAPLGFSNSYVS